MQMILPENYDGWEIKQARETSACLPDVVVIFLILFFFIFHSHRSVSTVTIDNL
jgi:hypothetical protein